MPIVFDRGRVLFTGPKVSMDLNCCCSGIVAGLCCLNEIGNSITLTVESTTGGCGGIAGQEVTLIKGPGGIFTGSLSCGIAFSVSCDTSTGQLKLSTNCSSAPGPFSPLTFKCLPFDATFTLTITEFDLVCALFCCPGGGTLTIRLSAT